MHETEQRKIGLGTGGVSEKQRGKGFPLSESGMSRNFWGRIKGAKYRFALQEGTWDFS